MYLKLYYLKLGIKNYFASIFSEYVIEGTTKLKFSNENLTWSQHFSLQISQGKWKTQIFLHADHFQKKKLLI